MNRLIDRRGIETAVYEPAEDSYLLVRTAVDHVDENDLVLDVGTGSGFVGATISRETGASAVAIDVNPFACERASRAGLSTVRGDLVSPFLADTFDVVLFNPPYLPTDPDDEWEDWMEVALSGGPTGRSVIESFLDEVSRVLSPRGRVFLLVSSLTGVEEVVVHAAKEGFSAIALADETFPYETLTVLKLIQ